MKRPREWLRGRWRSLTARRAVLSAVMVAAAVRLWCLAGVPLTITNDGAWYILWARKLLALEPVDWPPARTPGYPLFLGAVFGVCGEGPGAVLGLQHALGCMTVGLIAGMTSRLAGARWGLVTGVLAALDPAPLALESYVLTESLAVLMLVACAAAVLMVRGRRWWASLALGAGLGVLCLVRPAFQIVVPFLVIGWLLSGDGTRAAGSAGAGESPPWNIRGRTRGRVMGAAALVLGFVGATGGWLVHNWRVGVPGISSSNSTVLWIAVCESGMLAPDFPLPEDVRAEYTRLGPPGWDSDENAHRFVAGLDAWHAPENAALLRRWAMYSVRSRPAAYATMAVRALGWQLELFPRRGRVRQDETRWLIRRLSQDGLKLGQRQANLNVSGEPTGLEAFRMPAGHGLMAGYLRWWSDRWWLGLPRLGLFLTAVGAAVLAARRREWGLALVLLGTLAYVGAHAVFLLAPSRYSLPCWEVWWVGPAVIRGLLRRAATCASADATG